MLDETYAPPDEPLKILYDDHLVLMVDKPSGLLSVPGRGPHLADCMLSRLQAAFPEALLVHRLDRDTSGVMVFARSPHAQRHLGQQFENRQSRKVYVARVAGRLEPKTGEVDLPLIVDWPNRPKQKVCHETGKQALTQWRVQRYEEGDITRVKLLPKTGRSHQLRVHMQAIGHPILGDPFYADPVAHQAPRLMLHAEELRVNHPDGGRSVTVRCKAPF